MASRLGKIIIVIAFVLSQNPFAIAFMIPAYLFGVFLVWTNRTKIARNVLWSTLPLVLWYPWFILPLFIQIPSQQKFDIYFTGNYTGAVIIVYNISCGQKIEKKNGRLQLYIPEDGVLLYQGNIRMGTVDHKYYDILINGNSVPIPDRDSTGNLYAGSNIPPPSLRKAGVGASGGRTSNESEPMVEYDWISLGVGSRDSLDNQNISNEYMFGIADFKVRQCVLEKMRTTSATHQQGQLHKK